MTGAGVTYVAVPYQVYVMTGSTLTVGLMYLCVLFPQLIVPLAGGAIADAVDRRRFLLATETGLAVVSVGFALNAGFGHALWAVFALQAAGTILFSLGMPALRSVMPRVVPEDQIAAASALADVYGNSAALAGPAVAGLAIAMLGMPMALFPAVALHLGGTKEVGLLFAAPSAGAIAVGVCSGWIGRVRRQGVGVLVAAACWGAAIVGFGFASSIGVAIALLAVAGAADFVSGVLRGTIVLTATPDAMRGRVSGIEFAQVAAAPSLGNLEAGVVASLAGVRASIVSGGVGCVLGVAVLALAVPRFRRYRAPASG